MRIYNTLTHQKEEFVPLQPGRVLMYACGPTVYDFIHLGNARPLVLFDLLRRFLEYRGYTVTFAQNFTDVDDKMIRRAQQEGKSLQEIGDTYIAEYYQDADALGVLRATIQPRATESMEAILKQVQTLLDRGHAYVAEDGVYFSTRSFPDYGKLSHFHLDELEVGASERLDTGEGKRDASDFAIWKFQKPGEPAWPAPWGDGRPGWHIECSSMIHKHLGETIDIHCGGQDLVFPHHENEIAQSECTTGKPFARYWMHNGFITIRGEKISKSLGNAQTIREMGQKYSYMALRYFLLSAHYRTPIQFDPDLLEAAKQALQRLENCSRALWRQVQLNQESGETETEQQLLQTGKVFVDAFIRAMEDDLNTPDALGALFSYIRSINVALKASISSSVARQAYETLQSITEVLGLPLAMDSESEAGIPEEVTQWMLERSEAKRQKDFVRADQLRDQIRSAGYSVIDTAEGPHLERL